MFYWTQLTRITVLTYSQNLFKIIRSSFGPIYVKRIRKDHSGVSSLIVNGETNSCAKDKARILNNQFESAFTNEDLSNISIMTPDAIPQMPSISFSAHGILENLVLGKAPGPDVLTT